MACDVQTIVTNGRCAACALGSIANGSELILWCMVNGGSAPPVPPEPGGSYLLRDDGDFILLDDGGLIEINV